MAVEIQPIAGVRRSVYRQLDNTIELADVCTCDKDPLTCLIDDHKIKARMRELELDD